MCQLKLGLDIQNQTKVWFRKPKNPICLPGGHFESDVTEIASVLAIATNKTHMTLEIEIRKQNWVTFRKPRRLQTEGRMDGRTNGRTDWWTRWIQYTPTPIIQVLTWTALDRACMSNYIPLFYVFLLLIHALMPMLVQLLLVSRRERWQNLAQLYSYK